MHFPPLGRRASPLWTALRREAGQRRAGGEPGGHVHDVVADFAALFQRFLREVVDLAPVDDSALVARLRAHLGSDPLQAP